MQGYKKINTIKYSTVYARKLMKLILKALPR